MSMRCLLVANKADAEGADIALEFLEELLQRPVPHLPGVGGHWIEGLDNLALSVYAALSKVRVYLKSRGTQPDYGQPLVLDQGSVIQDAALYGAQRLDTQNQVRPALGVRQVRRPAGWAGLCSGRW